MSREFPKHVENLKNMPKINNHAKISKHNLIMHKSSQRKQKE